MPSWAAPRSNEAGPRTKSEIRIPKSETSSKPKSGNLETPGGWNLGRSRFGFASDFEIRWDRISKLQRPDSMSHVRHEIGTWRERRVGYGPGGSRIDSYRALPENPGGSTKYMP